MRNTIERALWTAVQTFTALISLDGLMETFTLPTGQMLLASLVASALSAVKTMAQERLRYLGDNAG